MRKLAAPALWLSVDLALITAGTLAQAHALLDHASPGVGSSIATAPPVLSLSFTQELEPAFTSVTVTNAAATAPARQDRFARWVMRFSPL